MRMQSMKQHMVLSFVFATGFAFINMWVSGTELAATLLQLPLFFGVMFLTMRATNRITVAMTKRFRSEPPPELPALEPPEPTSERPEHAQKRRRRRRRRGRGRRA